MAEIDDLREWEKDWPRVTSKIYAGSTDYVEGVLVQLDPNAKPVYFKRMSQDAPWETK